MICKTVLSSVIILISPFFVRTESLQSSDQLLDDSFNWNPWINTNIPHQGTFHPQPNEEHYDFIIVGSGSAGSVIANRLSEIKSWKILLLEAGFPENFLAEFPSLTVLMQLTDYNWGYVTEPQKHSCRAMVEKRCAWPRGRALGGSSVINYMVYTRGNPEDYNHWKALGNPGWAYEDVLPYFLKSERAMLNYSNEAYHNKYGYLAVSTAFSSKLGNTFILAGQELGYNITDYNSPDEIGFSRVQANIKRGRRQSSAKAFLTPILDRPNLEILTGAMVTKILIDPFTKHAYGVEYTWRKRKMRAFTKKEVILSAGALNSAQLLMLSGVGPRIHLDELGISTLSNLPVGKTIYDQMGFEGLIITTNFSTSATTFDPLQILKWYETGEGPISSVGSEALAFINTAASKNNSYPDVELILRAQSATASNGTFLRSTMRVSEDYYNQMYKPLEGIPSFTILPILLHPKSAGFMKLKSTNPYEYPLFFPNYFTDSEKHDIKTLIAAIRFIMRLTETTAFTKLNAQISKKPFVECDNLPFNSDEYWECALRLMSVSIEHNVSTCKMGPPDDASSVVNYELKVYGIRNLRVADAGVIPFPLSGHTHGPAVMIGEKASDIIKREWGAL